MLGSSWENLCIILGYETLEPFLVMDPAGAFLQVSVCSQSCDWVSWLVVFLVKAPHKRIRRPVQLFWSCLPAPSEGRRVSAPFGCVNTFEYNYINMIKKVTLDFKSHCSEV